MSKCLGHGSYSVDGIIEEEKCLQSSAWVLTLITNNGLFEAVESAILAWRLGWDHCQGTAPLSGGCLI
jgi:hypothetical protein